MRRPPSPSYASSRRPHRKDSDGATEQRGSRSGLSEMGAGNSAPTWYDSRFRETPARPSPRGQGSSVEECLAVPARPLSIFYGYPDQLIARWCGVSVATARLYKSGAPQAVPSGAASVCSPPRRPRPRRPMERVRNPPRSSGGPGWQRVRSQTAARTLADRSAGA